MQLKKQKEKADKSVAKALSDSERWRKRWEEKTWSKSANQTEVVPKEANRKQLSLWSRTITEHFESQDQ